MTQNQKLFYFFVVPGLFIQTLGALLYFVILEDGELASAVYTLTKILILIWPIYWIFTREKVRQAREQKKSLVLGLVSGTLISIFILSLYFIFSEFFSSFIPLIESKIAQFNLKANYIIFALFLSFIHSGLEEYYWRWFIFSGLKTKFSPTPSAIIGSIGFSLHHFIILSQIFPVYLTIPFGVAVAIGGYIWCAIYQKTNSLLGSWLSHMLVDLAIMTVGYLLIF